MKKVTLLITIVFCSWFYMAQESEEKTSLSVTQVSDTFFGFAPLVTGSYKLSEKTDFTFYGIYWSGGTGIGWGNWAEFSTSVNFLVSESIDINLQLGFTHGNL